MVSKRQKEAKRGFKLANPGLFPKPEPTPPKDPTKKKKSKQTNFKRKKTKPIGDSDLSSQNPNPNDKTLKRGLRKHPLRVPGMKPGESCFICKAKTHIAKLCPEKAQWERNKICLHCRSRGHSLKNCPNQNDKSVDKKLCYNCGESGHSLDKCPQPLQDGGTKFASCFICNETGHLSKNCPKNTHGIYPKGGCCKICSGVTHLAKDCPNKGNNVSTASNKHTRSFSISADRPTGKVTKFVSGDDLEDDFMIDEAGPTSKNSEDSNSKSKKKPGPKVVNFVG